MLIKSLKAKNFMKYKLLELDNLPEQGVIGIFGENESGKSTIGEAISFALFGETSKYGTDDFDQLINWDEEECEICLHFLVPSKGLYIVERSINRHGVLKATVYKQGAQKALRMGFHPVSQRIAQLLKFDFEAFRYTFYLAQKELDILHKDDLMDSKAVLFRMLGLDNFKAARRLAQEQLEELVQKRNRCESELAATRALVEDLKKIDQSGMRQKRNTLQELQAAKHKTQQAQEALRSQLEQLTKTLAARKQLETAWQHLEASFTQAFHQNHLTKEVGQLSRIYAFLRKQRELLNSQLEQRQQRLESTDQQGRELETLRERLRDLAEMVAFHHGKLKKRLAAPQVQAQPLSEAFSDNLPANLRAVSVQLEQSQRRQRWLLLASISVAGLGVILLGLALYLTLSISQTAWTWACWSALAVCILSAVGLAGLGLALRPRIQALTEQKALVEHEIAKLEHEIDICRNFQTRNFQRLRDDVLALSDEQIHRKLATIEKDFANLLGEMDILETITERHVKSVRVQQEEVQQLKERLAQLENLARLIEGLGSDLDLTAMPHKQTSEPLANLQELEQEVYQRLQAVQYHRLALRENQSGQVAEIDQAWQEFDSCRNRLRELTGVKTSATVLAQLQAGFQQEDPAEFKRVLATQQETCLAAWPTVASLTEEQTSKQNSLASEERREQELAQQIRLLEEELEQYEKQLQRKGELVSKLQALGQQLQPLQRRIKVYQLSAELLSQTAEQAQQRFGPAIAKIIEKVLPHITQQRYRHLRVSEELEVEIFSPEKGDFVDLEELSGGTVDQIFLALRLAFSQAMLYAKVGRNYKQFLFFDEPFSSFDEQRASAFLELLDMYRTNFAQIFVSAPRHYPLKAFDCVIQTSLHGKLVIDSSNAEARSTSESVSATIPDQSDQLPAEETTKESDLDDIRVEYDPDI